MTYLSTESSPSAPLDSTQDAESKVSLVKPDRAEKFAAPAAGTARVTPAPITPPAVHPLLGDDDVRPEPLKLIGVTLWALAVTLVGLVTAAAMVMLQLSGRGGMTAVLVMTPICGLLGIALAIAALVTITRDKVPYILLGASSLILLIYFGFVFAA
ncbi:hypothetical protein [Fodinicola acaciae]|uniref:hypothetical protein n=1 Tax=Fodinicola acaciae TaxID=2681555 RepID=UPI0013CFC2FA|nr:hypothetical protein [Fodinicola acaciae]